MRERWIMHIKRFVHLLTFRHTAYFTIRFFRRPFHRSRREHRKSSDKPPPVGGGSRDGLLYVFHTADRSLLRCVTRYGFSERMGPVVYGTDPGETFLGRDFGQGKGYSENTASEIDNEIRDIMDESYETARRILTEHMTELHRVAGVLMEREKISGEEFDALMKGENLAPFGLDTPAPAAAPASAEQPAAPEQPSEPSDEN